jgi:hypothetical protein
MSRSKLATMRSLGALLILTVPLSGCDLVDAFRIFAGPPVTKVVTVVECPASPGAPPEEVLDAIAPLMDDPSVREWVDGYDKHLEKLDTCQ